jgi:hypothetical protein
MKNLIGTLTCPECRHKQKMEIPTKGCMYFYVCENCKKIIKGKNRCVFCSYADKECPDKC